MMGAKSRVLLCLAAVVLAVTNAQHVLRNTSKCVPSLNTDRARFDVCKTTECFIFIDEPPFVFVPDPVNERGRDEPFRCYEHLKYAPGLEGAFFDIIKDMPTLLDSYCVWGGADCSFNSMVEFVNSSTPEQGYRWIAAGLLFVVPERIQLNLRPSASLLEDKLLVIGPPQYGTEGVEAWNVIAQPFTRRAWLAIFLFFMFLMVIRFGMVFVFHGTKEDRDYSLMIQRFWQVGTQPKNRGTDEDEDDWEFLNETWMGNAKLFLGVTVILYEILVAVKVLEASTTGELVTSELEKFAIFQDTTQEFFFMQMNNINTTANHKWERYPSQEQVYDALKKKGGPKYTLMYSILNQHEMTTRPHLCDTLRVYEDFSPRLARARGRKPPSISGHWLYSGNVPLDRTVEIDREIVERKVGRLRRIVERIAGVELPERCQSKVRRIDWMLIIMFFGVAQGPALILLLGSLIFLTCRRRKRRGWPPKVAEELSSSVGEDDAVSESTFAYDATV